MKTDVVFEAKTKKYHVRYWSSLTWAARKNRENETESEKILWNKLLRGKQLGYKFTRQKPINRFIADFYCSELNLVIEVDGGSHDFKKERDFSRDKFLKSCGIKTLRINSDDVINDFEKVEKKIKNFINPLPCQGKG
jgi:very-short-patch-repair endonuclease